MKISVVVPLLNEAESLPELVDAIVEIVQTGSSLLENDLVELDTLLEAEAVLIGHPSPRDPGARDVLLRRVQGVQLAARHSLVEYNCPADRIDEAAAIAPGRPSGWATSAWCCSTAGPSRRPGRRRTRWRSPAGRGLSPDPWGQRPRRSRSPASAPGPPTRPIPVIRQSSWAPAPRSDFTATRADAYG